MTITSPPDGGTVNAGESRQATVHAIDNQPGDTGVQRVVVDISGEAVVGGGPCAFTLSFTAFDAGGNALCSGSIGLESLGDR